MKLIPTGIENFKELIDKDYYYVDKTNLIVNIINEKVVLYTRPRRFGKTLNMSMLYYFFYPHLVFSSMIKMHWQLEDTSECIDYLLHVLVM